SIVDGIHAVCRGDDDDGAEAEGAARCCCSFLPTLAVRQPVHASLMAMQFEHIVRTKRTSPASLKLTASRLSGRIMVVEDDLLAGLLPLVQLGECGGLHG